MKYLMVNKPERKSANRALKSVSAVIDRLKFGTLAGCWFYPNRLTRNPPHHIQMDSNETSYRHSLVHLNISPKSLSAEIHF